MKKINDTFEYKGDDLKLKYIQKVSFNIYITSQKINELLKKDNWGACYDFEEYPEGIQYNSIDIKKLKSLVKSIKNLQDELKLIAND